MWILYGIISALFLGIYDISKKAALNRNAVFPVLLISTLFGALPWIPLVLISRIQPEWLAATPFFSASSSTEPALAKSEESIIQGLSART